MTCKGHVTAPAIIFKIHITLFFFFRLFVSDFSNTEGLQKFRVIQYMVHYTCATTGFAERCHDPDDSHLYMCYILSPTMSDTFSSVHEKCYTFLTSPHPCKWQHRNI